MYLRQLLRKPHLPLIKSSFSSATRIPRRFQSSTSPEANAKTQARADKVLNRVPRFLRKYTDGLRNAPVTHVVAFLILHEITAVVPLIGLASCFHYTNWLPSLFSEGAYISSAVEKFDSYFRRKQWFGLSQEDSSIPAGKQGKMWNISEAGTKIVLEVATAYAVTKAILPLRLMLSVWLTPWFARVAIGKVGNRLMGLGRAWRERGKAKGAGVEMSRSAAVGTGATGMSASTVGKDALKK